MQNSPLFSEAELQEGCLLIEKGCVKNLLFSEGTYQIEIVDQKKKKVFWPFLQVSDEGEVKDHFCSCKAAEEKGVCAHQAAAWLKVFKKQEEPLHVRFRDSLWNQLGLMGSKWMGFEPSSLTKKENGFEAKSPSGKKLISLRPLSTAFQKKLRQFIVARVPETEETSLKFSNLSAEEIALWKKGVPSLHLQYELSFWSDLAKEWMLLQEEGKKYTLVFTDPDKTGLPKKIEVIFEGEIAFSFYIAEANWAHLIPSLNTIDSPLRVFDVPLRTLRKMVYDPLKKALLLDWEEHASSLTKDQKEGIKLGEWLFVPEVGFYPAKSDPLLEGKEVPFSKMALFLQRYKKWVHKQLVGSKVHLYPASAHYHLFFDADYTLHLNLYLFEVGDLNKINAAYFGKWAYLPDKGFYELEDRLFEESHKMIPKDQVSDFVSKHRHWLYAHEGFQTHVSNIEAKLSFKVDAEKNLCFESILEVDEEEEEAIDFGEWVYFKGRGFYAKVSSKKQGQVLKGGLKIAPSEISSFIKASQDELEQVPHFFSTVTPLSHAGLNITLDAEEKIVVNPEYHFLPPYTNKHVDFFADYTYVEGEGFCETPFSFRLPPPYFNPCVIEKNSELFFITYEMQTLKPFISTCDARLLSPDHLHVRLLQVEQDASFHKGGWRVELEYVSETGSVEAYALWEASNEGKRYLFSPAGLIFLKDPRFNWLKGLSKKRWSKKGKELRLTTLEWIRLFVFEEVEPPVEEESARLFLQFKEFQTGVEPYPEGLKSQLRLYQQNGLKWLWFLYIYGLSGLLCDEMGLGKTHQAMALLASVYHAQKNSKFLVVCPTSVIYHWQELLKRFLPHLRVLVFYGAQRSLENFTTHADLLLTSYGTVRSEKQVLEELLFEVVVLDEIQIAKNVRSQTHKALRTLQARMRLGLTGTPLENRLLELKALFDIVLPTYMPVESVFKELFVNPIEKQQDKQKKELLLRFIRPFVLRRKKSEVLLELPEKTEEISYAALSEEQQALYKEIYQAAKDPLLKQIAAEEKQIPFVHIFALLTKLKQICNHPALFLGVPAEFHKHSSGKWDLFVQLLQETRDSGQKLVVFSQYLGMLDIIETYLKEENIHYASIRGSTRDRQGEMEKFRTDPMCEVFIGSLQAAGVGIDLIAASVVIHYDRWWNPAKENQATDRVHRMGQSRGVQVFKLVTKGTIEEHIHRLIEKKMGLLHDVVGFDDQDQLKSLTREELIELMRLMEEEDPGR